MRQVSFTRGLLEKVSAFAPESLTNPDGTCRQHHINRERRMKVQKSSEGRPLSARELRRVAKVRELIDRWWLALPQDQRPDYLRGWKLEQAVGYPIEQLAPALKELGWQRVQFREHLGEPRGYWVAPGRPSPVRPLGRPPNRASSETPPIANRPETRA